METLDTTIYVYETTMLLIDQMCEVGGMKRNQAIAALLVRAMRDPQKSVRAGALVRYQRRDHSGRWRRMHVRLPKDRADYAKDMRGFFRQSFSLIIALAVREYMDEIVRLSKRGQTIDNYPFSNYIIVRNEEGGLISWMIWWGDPENLGGIRHSPRRTGNALPR